MASVLLFNGAAAGARCHTRRGGGLVNGTVVVCVSPLGLILVELYCAQLNADGTLHSFRKGNFYIQGLSITSSNNTHLSFEGPHCPVLFGNQRQFNGQDTAAKHDNHVGPRHLGAEARKALEPHLANVKSLETEALCPRAVAWVFSEVWL